MYIPLCSFLCTQPVLDASTEAPFGSSATLDPLYVGVAPLASVGVDMELLDQVKEKVLRDGIRFAVDLVTALVDFGPDAPAAAGKPHGGSGKGKDGKPAPAAAPATHANTIGRFVLEPISRVSQSGLTIITNAPEV